MGCNASNRVAVAQLPSEELEKNQEAKSQTTSASIARAGAVTSWDGAAWPVGTSERGSKVEDKAREGDSPEEFAERFTPSQKRSNVQSTDALLTSEFISQSRTLQEIERQKSSDILEELRMQGIIRSQSTTARTEEVYENKIREEELSNTAQHTAFFPATAHQTTGEQTEKDCISCGSHGGTDTPQPSPLDEEPGVLIKEITAGEATNDYTEGSTIESDITYNCINETIWI
ncbi:stathmin domain-containing protein 1 [Cygnus olor]|uniref:stathmin domain-containing protein 1 n=1 Tax=Cygnus olor TaxID=8869 RepID=UPI001ADDF8A3|nr:stathmin domain-containing protein 1 [Cygnus olor]